MVAWLHVAPEGEKESRGSREPWPLPDVEPFGYVASWFSELRMDYRYPDIKAWSDVTGQRPTPKEADLLMMMSNVYSTHIHKYRAKEFNLQPPYDGRDPEEVNKMVSDKMNAAFARLG